MSKTRVSGLLASMALVTVLVAAGLSTLASTARHNLQFLECLHRVGMRSAACGTFYGTHGERASYSRGLDAWFAGRGADAERELTAAVASDPYDYPAAFYLGFAARSLGHEQRALSEWRRIGASRYFVQRGRLRNSIDDLRTAIALGNVQADDYYALGDALLTANAPEAAVLYRQGLARDASDGAHAKLARARLAELSGDLPQAIVEYRHAISQAPQYQEPYLRLGRVYRERHETGAAAAVFSECARHTGYFWCLLSASELAREAGDLDAARMWAQEARFREPRNPYPLIHLGNLAELTGDITVARSAYEQASRLDASTGLPSYYLGMLCTHVGDWQGAIPPLTKAVASMPSNLDARLALADAYAHTGQPSAAAAAYQAVLTAAPTNQRAREGLAQVTR